MIIKKKPVYKFYGYSTPLTLEDLENYNYFSKFYVYKDGTVFYVSPEMPLEAQLQYLVGGKYMYRDSLKELIS